MAAKKDTMKKENTKLKSVKYASEGSKALDVSDNSKWDAEDLIKAMEIMGDGERFKKAHKHIKQKNKAIKSLRDLHKAYASKVEEEDMEDEE